MHVYSHFMVLHMIILVAAKRAANAVAQKWKVLSCPSKCILICRCKCQSKGHNIISRVWTYLFLYQVRLKPEKVPNCMRNLCFSASPPQVGVMPLLKKKILRPKNLHEYK